jgi:hypothetical protein
MILDNPLFLNDSQSWHELCNKETEAHLNAVTQGSAARLNLGLDHEKQNI